MTTLRADFVEALRRLAGVFDDYHARTGHRPVLVGGAAASIYTGGQIASGDFDIVAGDDEAFDAVILAAGFEREDRLGHLRVGYDHPDIPAIGVQLVSGRLFDGRAEVERVALMPIEDGGTIALASIEDLIADRLGQHAASLGQDREMLLQARLLRRLAGELDRAYLLQRVREESGDPTLLDGCDDA